jgi:hypothetical protein
MGLTRFELVTPRLSSVCSNQLSYRPPASSPVFQRSGTGPVLSKLDRTCARQPAVYQIDLSRKLPAFSFRLLAMLAANRLSASRPQLFRAGGWKREAGSCFSRKEVIQPQVLLQLPCYDFTPITNHTLGACLPCGLARRLLVQPAFVM